MARHATLRAGLVVALGGSDGMWWFCQVVMWHEARADALLASSGLRSATEHANATFCQAFGGSAWRRARNAPVIARCRCFSKWSLGRNWCKLVVRSCSKDVFCSSEAEGLELARLGRVWDGTRSDMLPSLVRNCARIALLNAMLTIQPMVWMVWRRTWSGRWQVVNKNPESELARAQLEFSFTSALLRRWFKLILHHKHYWYIQIQLFPYWESTA
jgi:hypothetical protein